MSHLCHIPPIRADGADGHPRPVPQAQHQQAPSRASGLSLPAAQPEHHPVEPCLGGGHHPHSVRRGFVYLFAVIGWASRRVLSWRLSNTLTTDFCKEAVQEAIARHGKPEIFNSDQGCQFTSLDFTGLLKDNGIEISMDGKGCWRDNVFVERLWKSVKYEEVYLHAYDRVSDAKRDLDFKFYNQNRPHTALDDKTPDEFYFDNLPALQKAA